MTQQQLVEDAVRLVTGFPSGATLTEGKPDKPPLPRDEALQLAIQEAIPRIEARLRGLSASKLLDQVNRELASVVAVLDGPPGRPELALHKQAVRRGYDLIKEERRRLRLEAEQIVLMDAVKAADRRWNEEWERVEAAGRAAQEAGLLSQFRAEEAEAAAAVEHKRFLAWRSKRGL